VLLNRSISCEFLKDVVRSTLVECSIGCVGKGWGGCVVSFFGLGSLSVWCQRLVGLGEISLPIVRIPEPLLYCTGCLDAIGRLMEKYDMSQCMM